MLKKTGILVVALLACTQIGTRAAEDKASAASNPMEGTWQLVSSKNGDATEYEKAPTDTKRLKIINKTHFVWVEVDAANGIVKSMAGGPYTLKDDTYSEKIEFGLEGIEDLRGKDQVFKIKLKDDTYEQVGALSNGFKIDEIWKKVK
jgi:hypothetical protein